jgi:hypothetical protein
MIDSAKTPVPGPISIILNLFVVLLMPGFDNVVGYHIAVVGFE